MYKVINIIKIIVTNFEFIYDDLTRTFGYTYSYPPTSHYQKTFKDLMNYPFLSFWNGK